MSIEDVIRVARSQIGTTESPPGSNRQKYGAKIGPNGVAWCAQFCCWVWEHAGYPDLLPRTASVYVLWEYANQRGWLVDTPQVGDIPVYDFPRGSEWDHVGAVVTAVDGPYAFRAIEGNTSSDDRGSQSNGGGVFERHRSIHLVRDFIRPPIPFPEDDMPLTADEMKAIAREVWAFPYSTGPGKPPELAQDRLVQAARGTNLTGQFQALRDAITAGAAGVDVEALAAAIVRRLPAGNVIDPKALAAATADELATRLVR